MSFAKPILLLVEDDLMVGTVTTEQLQDEGFEVVAAKNASEAETELSRRDGGFDAVILDVNLGPGPSGYDVALALRRRWRNLPIVFTTADAAGPLFASHVGRAVHIGKPYTFNELMDALKLAKGAAPH